MENYAIWMEIVYMKTKDFYGDIAKDVEKKIDTSNYVVENLLLIDKKLLGH